MQRIPMILPERTSRTPVGAAPSPELVRLSRPLARQGLFSGSSQGSGSVEIRSNARL